MTNNTIHFLFPLYDNFVEAACGVVSDPSYWHNLESYTFHFFNNGFEKIYFILLLMK